MVIGEIGGIVRSGLEGYSVALCCELGFPTRFRNGHDSNGGLGEDVAWRHGMTQALNLPLHDDGIAKSRMINSGFNFMLAICA